LQGKDKKRLLFISGSFGLGHITRDLAIASDMRKRNPDIEFSWWAVHPASSFLKYAGETLISEDYLLSNINVAAEKAADTSGVNMGKTIPVVF
jgi:hypothetical protein